MHFKHFKLSIYEIGALCIITFAIVLRIILISQQWPVTNSDEGTIGIMALHIAHLHERPIFFYGQGYMGTLQAFMAAFLFQFFGPSLFAVRLGLIIFLALFFISTYLLTCSLYSKNLALVTLFILSLGSVSELVTQLRAIGGYAETLLFSSLLLLLATWLAYSYMNISSLKLRLLRYFLYCCWGYLVGVGIWTDLLIMPFVVISGAFLLIMCWPDLDSPVPSCVIASFTLGILPLFIYNIKSLPQKSTLFYFLLDYRSDIPGHTLVHVRLLQRLLGALLVGLPSATGANPICSTQNVPFFGLYTPADRHCIILQGSWSLGCIVLWLIAVALALWALWQRRHQLQKYLVDAEAHYYAARYGARLMLLASAALTLILFAFSPVAGLDPWMNSRYLLCLLAVTPALIAPLWQAIYTGSSRIPGMSKAGQTPLPNRLSRVGFFANIHGKWPRPRSGEGGDGQSGDPWRMSSMSPLHNPTSPAPTGTMGLLSKNLPVRAPEPGTPVQASPARKLLCLRQLVIKVTSACVLIYICAMLVQGTIGTFNAAPAAQAWNEQQNDLITRLLHMGATRVYSEYWTCNRIIFQSNERIICSVIGDNLHAGYNRYDPYYFVVKWSSAHAFYVLPLGSPMEINFARSIAHSQHHYQQYSFDGYMIFQPLN